MLVDFRVYGRLGEELVGSSAHKVPDIKIEHAWIIAHRLGADALASQPVRLPFNDDVILELSAFDDGQLFIAEDGSDGDGDLMCFEDQA